MKDAPWRSPSRPCPIRIVGCEAKPRITLIDVALENAIHAGHAPRLLIETTVYTVSGRGSPRKRSSGQLTLTNRFYFYRTSLRHDGDA